MLSSIALLDYSASNQKLGAFLRLGTADGDTAQVDYDVALGLVGKGWMPGRPDSEFGVGVTRAHNSDTYMSVNAGSDKSETIYQAYYLDTLYPVVTFEPTVALVENPGTVATNENALLFGTRVGISF
ncbi:MAG: carbohydrate porin [Rickettsiales bacterium]